MSDPSDLHWTTEITQIRPNEIRLRGYRIDELMGRASFARVAFLALTGRWATEAEARVIEAMLVASVDHGATPPSALATRTVASTGAPLNASVAAGILAINRHHGGAIEACMGALQETLQRAEAEGLPNAAATVVQAYRAAKKRLPGLGHRIHTQDPRTARLFALAQEAGVSGRGVEALRALEAALAEATGRHLPINVDGAIAALLVDLDVPPALANAFFIIARVPGLVAHAYEEQTTQRPMRRIHPTDHTYTGPAPRPVPPETE